MYAINWETTRKEFLQSLLIGDSENAILLTRQTLNRKVSPVTFFEKCINPVLDEIGDLFENLEIYLPEMTQAGEIVKIVNETVLVPEINNRNIGGVEQSKLESKGKVLLATVKGDIHDIGKNMVGLMLQVNGFEVIDMGTDVSPLDIVDCAESEQVDIIGLSSLLTTCLPYMKDVINILDSKAKRAQYKVIIGGASPTPVFADEIGADGFGKSAQAAVKICKEIMYRRI